VYLDSAATSQKPRQVLETLLDYYERHNANVHRSPHLLGEEATQMYEEARARAARFIGAPDASCIVFNRGTTESLNLVAHGWARKFLREGDEILISELEHHSNIVPWQLAAQATGAKVRYIPITDDGLFDMAALPSVLTERTKLVSISGMSNVLGTIPPVRALADAAHASGALLCVDGAQLVAHAPVDVAELGCDFLAFSGHKMLGPMASGGLFARRELLEDMDPFLGGGEMISQVLPDHSTWNEVPWKFEAGTMNVADEIGLHAAIDYLDEIGMDNVRSHEESLAAYAIQRLADAGAQIFGPTDVLERGAEVSFWFKDIHPHDLATILDQEGVAIRAGHHCAQILMRRLDVPATARASFYVYNDRADVDALVDSLGRAAQLFGS
jgi:cysteine desulfurase / selenocysteine lyase